MVDDLLQSSRSELPFRLGVVRQLPKELVARLQLRLRLQLAVLDIDSAVDAAFRVELDFVAFHGH